MNDWSHHLIATERALREAESALLHVGPAGTSATQPRYRAQATDSLLAAAAGIEGALAWLERTDPGD